jgi:hypothetical protein
MYERFLSPMPLTWPPPARPVDIATRTIVYTRHRYNLARRCTRRERRALARAGTIGRRGARRVPKEYRDGIAVYLPDGDTETRELHAQIETILRQRLDHMLVMACGSRSLVL